MSVSYYSKLVAAIKLNEVISVQELTSKETMYNPNTGIPFEVSKTTKRTFLGQMEITKGGLCEAELELEERYGLLLFGNGSKKELIGVLIAETEDITRIDDIEQKLAEVSQKLQALRISTAPSLFLINYCSF